ncbi:MAG TPA: lipase maturation factor family protein, partial [Polyangiales bacterium]|nr:lipase maturation factor family protein [Polyangiales bacterium]
MLDALSLSPALVWGLYIRALGLVLLISFVSIAPQIALGAGREGGLPIGLRLDKMRRDFPTWRRFFYFPTLLWANHSDAMLRALTWVGIGASALVVYGGPWSFWALLVCYLCYLSLDMAIGLIFPWDSLLFESLILALFLPATLPLPQLAAAAPAAPALAWVCRLMVFRVMLGFGKQKFLGSNNKDFAYLKGFLIWQPLPSWLGWYAQKLPVAMLRPMVVFMFIAEIPVPFFAFFPGWPSIACAVVTIFLMVGIQAMGSFGYFSLMTIAACVPLFDNDTPRLLTLSGLFAPGAPIAANLYAIAYALGAAMVFPLNSWVAQSWHLWAVWYRLPRLYQLPFDIMRALHPFRWLHPYGVFPPNVGPAMKGSLLVEVSWDRKTWHEVDFHYSPSNPHSKPRFVSPYHPRGDQAVIYETFGMNPTSLIASMLGPWDPYSFGSQPAANTLAQRICEGHGLKFMKGTVLKQHAEPPAMTRISTIMLEPASLAEHRADGRWWRRHYVGPHIAPRGADPHFWDELLPEPEMWHFDAIFWRRRCRLQPMMERSRAGHEDAMSLALYGAPELSSDDVRRFWDELVPMIGVEARKSFDTLPDNVAAVHAAFDHAQQRALHRLLGRFSMLLVARLEPLYLGRGRKPELPAVTYFQIWMAVHHIIGQGKDAYLVAMAEPRSVASALAEVTPQTGLYYFSLFRFESMCFEAQKLRLVSAITPPFDEEKKKAMAYSTEVMTPLEKKVVAISQTFSGFFNVMPYIR